MAVTVASLRARWEEFAPTHDAVVQGAIDEATEECDERVFGGKFDHAVGLLAAHKLAISPQGQPLRLEAKLVQDSPHGTTTYGCEFDALARQCAGGFWAVGIAP